MMWSRKGYVYFGISYTVGTITAFAIPIGFPFSTIAQLCIYAIGYFKAQSLGV